ncbi:MAG: hypothetical protein LQ348_006033 [Seirophora lacunosa]|nr:MAG: hypothetical protein LQ348_006033 [Seirophora lacunosa]
MAEPKMAVASAVIVPEEAVQPEKRRISSFSEGSSKRPRLDSKASPDNIEAPTSPKAKERREDRRRGGQMEERKRGQRLFGALLGTLSQSSSSTAQKRRTDIERKQQDKLREQAEELDEQKKQRLESLLVVRRNEQKKYDKQSMHIRHSNTLAQAHFLQTRTEPKLYYMPWELLPTEDAKIKSQIEVAEASIQQETEELGARTPGAAIDMPADQKMPSPESKADGKPESEDAMDTVGSDANMIQEANGLANDESTDKKPEPTRSETEQLPMNQQESAKDNDDDGDEMVEADEDMVEDLIEYMERSSPLREYFDPRIQSRWVKLNGINYRTIVAPIYQVEVVDLAIDYLFAESDLTPRATVFLVEILRVDHST